MSVTKGTSASSLLSSKPWELPLADDCPAPPYPGVLPSTTTTTTSITTQTTHQGPQLRQTLHHTFNRLAEVAAETSCPFDSKVTPSTSAAAESEGKPFSLAVSGLAPSKVGDEKIFATPIQCSAALGSNSDLKGCSGKVARSHDELLSPVDASIAPPRSSFSVVVPLQPPLAVIAALNPVKGKQILSFHTLRAVASPTFRVSLSSDHTPPFEDHIHRHTFSKFRLKPGAASAGRSKTVLEPALTLSPRIDGSDNGVESNDDNSRLKTASRSGVLGSGDGAECDSDGGGDHRRTSPVLSSRTSAALLPGNACQANTRLRKYQAKLDQLRRGTDSKCKMLGALCVLRNHLTSDVVTMMHLVQTSRQRLDEQRVANKELMKYIDSGLDVSSTASARGIAVSAATATGTGTPPTYSQNNLTASVVSMVTAACGNITSGNNTTDVAQDGNNNAGTRNIAASDVRDVTDSDDDVVGNDLDFNPEIDNKNNNNSDAGIVTDLVLATAVGNNIGINLCTNILYVTNRKNDFGSSFIFDPEIETSNSSSDASKSTHPFTRPNLPSVLHDDIIIATVVL